MDISKLKKDTDAIDQGVWVGDIPGMGDLRLRVRGMTSPLVRETRAKKERAAEPEERMRDGSLTGEAGMRILGEVAAEAVLLDWDKLTDNGNPVKFNAALAREWCTNRQFESFLDAVVWAARNVDGTKAGETEAAAKN